MVSFLQRCDPWSVAHALVDCSTLTYTPETLAGLGGLKNRKPEVGREMESVDWEKSEGEGREWV